MFGWVWLTLFGFGTGFGFVVIRGAGVVVHFVAVVVKARFASVPVGWE